jgi:hypothetical protein
MKTKITQFIPAILALLAICFRYFSNWCIDSVSSCYGSWISQIALDITKPLYFFALYLLPLTIILIFVPHHLFKSWLKLALWAIPLSVIFIATTPVNFTGIGMDFFPFYRDDAARLAGEVFSGISLILIAYKYFAFRKTT